MLANQTQPRGKSLIYHNQRAFLPVMQDGFNVRRGTKGTASEENKEEKPHGHRHRRRRKHLAESNTHFIKKKKKKKKPYLKTPIGPLTEHRTEQS